jgi:hypothetical protein
MIKFEYKVLKPFTIYTDTKGQKKIAESTEEGKSGTSFRKSASYVDYERENGTVIQDPITQVLIDKNYLILKDPSIAE